MSNRLLFQSFSEKSVKHFGIYKITPENILYVLESQFMHKCSIRARFKLLHVKKKLWLRCKSFFLFFLKKKNFGFYRKRLLYERSFRRKFTVHGKGVMLTSPVNISHSKGAFRPPIKKCRNGKVPMVIRS